MYHNGNDTVFNNIILQITQNHVPVAQANSSFKCLDIHMLHSPLQLKYSILLRTYVQLFYMIVKMKVNTS